MVRFSNDVLGALYLFSFIHILEAKMKLTIVFIELE